jgi:hypothetical protein
VAVLMPVLLASFILPFLVSYALASNFAPDSLLFVLSPLPPSPPAMKSRYIVLKYIVFKYKDPLPVIRPFIEPSRPV